MKLAVYGLGRLGYPLFNVLARAGYEVVGIDPQWRPDWSMAPLHEPGLGWEGVPTSAVEASSEPQPADMSFIVVPTPSLDHGDRRGGFDSTYVEDALRQISSIPNNGNIAVIVSTVSPGTCDRLAKRFQDLRIVYNPTFIALGEVVRGLTRPNLLLIGATAQEAANAVRDIWEKATDPSWGPSYHYGSYVEVELIKLAVNAALGTKISLANSLGELFEAWGVDPKAVEVVGRDPRIGTAYFTPGSPITGPCLPRDNRALVRAAIEKNVEMPLSVSTDRIDHDLRYRVLNRVLAEKPNTVGILGMSYKYGSDVTEAAIGPWLQHRLLDRKVLPFTFDDILGGDLEKVLCSDVVVICQREYEGRWEPSLEMVDKIVRLWPV